MDRHATPCRRGSPCHRGELLSVTPPVPPRRVSLALSWVAVCIVVSGALVYGYLALIAHALSGGEYADFGAFWSIALIIGFGAFLPVELELARLLSSRPRGSRLPAGTLPAIGGLVGVS